MFRALLATASLAAGILTAPGAALAEDTTTPLTAAEMSAALKGVAGTTAPAELSGFGGDLRLSITANGTTQKGTAKFAADPAHGLGYFTATGLIGAVGAFAQAGKGQWIYFNGKTERAAVAMAGRPAARYAFQADTKLTLGAWTRDNLPVPSELVAEDTLHAGTKTVHDDGTVDYSYTDDELLTITFTAGSGGVLTAAKAGMPQIDEAFTWNYGPQTVTLPTTAKSIGMPTLMKALAYLDMAGKVKRAATGSAKVVETKSKKKTVKVANLRKWTRAEVSTANRNLGVNVLVVADIKGGVRISAINPFTKATAAYTVTASGKHAVARKA
ncbi:hypothetical protein Acy02nite_14780 [Actinoplanes cyaneus]|uniref:Lipoprotein n=1 Tax=Actinoplanes cyaneus TaxID=52696 RepID=A0A919IDU1_9ACTN|nr:hypothetical protein [Actinoplanes cyaneus]MCW2137548.1 hypothetical protein [Actinoplanes cyaneus]GID63597.1 hypothetical protein Acy02nite_14780 [Actinoplanes cyaneus]